jgi:hypothetical protein
MMIAESLNKYASNYEIKKLNRRIPCIYLLSNLLESIGTGGGEREKAIPHLMRCPCSISSSSI